MFWLKLLFTTFLGCRWTNRELTHTKLINSIKVRTHNQHHFIWLQKPRRRFLVTVASTEQKNDSPFSLICFVFSRRQRPRVERTGIVLNSVCFRGNKWTRLPRLADRNLLWSSSNSTPDAVLTVREDTSEKCQLETDERRHWCRMFRCNIVVIVLRDVRHGWLMPPRTRPLFSLLSPEDTTGPWGKLVSSELIDPERHWLVADQ